MIRSLGREDSAGAAEFLAKTAVLANLADLVSDSSIGIHELRDSLRLILPCDDTLLCKLGLGPEPEKVRSWAERLSKDDPRFSEARREELSLATLHWDSLMEAFRSGRDKESWERLDIRGRMVVYRNWLRAQCLVSSLEAVDKKMAGRLLQDLEREIPEEVGGPLRDCAKRLRSGDDLGGGFEGSSGGLTELGSGPSRTGGSGVPQSGILTPDQAQPIGEALRGPLAEELRGTIVGRKLLAFYEGPPLKDGRGRLLNQMNLGFQRFDDPGFMGLWDDGKISFSLGYLEGWLKKSKMTPAGLLADKPALAGLARALAPVLVHEGTHQTQTAYFEVNGIPDNLLNVEEEVGAAVNSALFVEENLLIKGEGYVHHLSELDNRLHRLLKKKGVEGIRYDREFTYLNLEMGSKFSLGMTTAKVFGKEQAQKDYGHIARMPKGSAPYRKISQEIEERIEKFGQLMKKYDQDEDWFYSVQDQLLKRARIGRP